MKGEDSIVYCACHETRVYKPVTWRFEALKGTIRD
jgi:hypothetical protein